MQHTKSMLEETVEETKSKVEQEGEQPCHSMGEKLNLVLHEMAKIS